MRHGEVAFRSCFKLAQPIRYGALALALLPLGGCTRAALAEPAKEGLARGSEEALSARPGRGASGFVALHAPAGTRPTAQSTMLDGRAGAILPNGRFVSPAGIDVSVGAPKPFGLALSPDGDTAA